jgi:RNA polymerase sigma-70 factor, ECF subfamily
MAVEDSITPEDFERIVLDHQKQIYRILFCHVRDADAADTLTQECFLRAYQKRSSFRGESSLSTWLIRIAINLARDHNRNRRLAFWRKLSQTDRMDLLIAAYAGPSPEKTLLDRETLKVILSEVERLSERQKTIFLLRFIEDMSLDAISEAMDLELGTVKSHLSRALASIRSACKHHQSLSLYPAYGQSAGVSSATVTKEDIS